MSSQKVSPIQRKKARRLAVQALYQWHVAESSITQIEAEFMVDNDMSKVDTGYFSKLLKGVTQQKSQLDAEVETFCSRSLSSLTPVELAILRLGAFELLQCIEVPYRVIINEGIELSKVFGANEAHRFVNGVLDRMAQKHRGTEIAASQNKPN